LRRVDDVLDAACSGESDVARHEGCFWVVAECFNDSGKLCRVIDRINPSEDDGGLARDLSEGGECVSDGEGGAPDPGTDRRVGDGPLERNVEQEESGRCAFGNAVLPNGAVHIGIAGYRDGDRYVESSGRQWVLLV
jgi:hypothetical protein